MLIMSVTNLQDVYMRSPNRMRLVTSGVHLLSKLLQATISANSEDDTVCLKDSLQHDVA